LSRYAYDAAHHDTDTVLTVFCPYGFLFRRRLNRLILKFIERL
jgi:hypothetical protein